MTTVILLGLLALAPLAAASVPAWPWLALANCETRVDWHHYTRTYEGAYGFTHAAWRQFRPPAFPRHANQATPEQQTIVARRIQRAAGWRAWPVCSVRLGLR